jgi:hypothetical protein
MMAIRIITRHVLLAALPLMAGVAAGWGFALTQSSCGDLVGPLLAPMCRGRQLQYQILFQAWGTAAGCALTAVLGIWLEMRRRRPPVGSEPPEAPPV